MFTLEHNIIYMITIDNKLVFGSFDDDDNIHISDKFTAVQKIIKNEGKYYILDSGNIYVNTTMLNDNFEIVSNNLGTNTKFIDIESTQFIDDDSMCEQIYAVSIDNKLYSVTNDFISNDNEICYANNMNIIAIYSAYTNHLILKSNTCEYYLVLSSDRTCKYLGTFDRILFTEDSVVTIKENNVGTVIGSISKMTFQILKHNINTLYEIPEGSYMRYYKACNDDTIVMKFPAENIDNKIVITLPLHELLCVCCTTGKVFVHPYVYTRTKEIPKLKDCAFSKLCERRYSNTKNANSAAKNN